MKITRSQIVRSLPIVAANLVPMAGVVEFGWPVVSLFILFILETWLVMALDSVRIALHKGGGLMEGFGSFVVPSLFVILQLFAAIAVLDSKTYALRSRGDVVPDFLRYIGSLGLAWPLAVLAVIHLTLFAREVAGKREGAFGMSFLRIFAMIGLFIFALGPTTLMGGHQSWALVAIVVIKAAFEIWIVQMQLEGEIATARYEKERREYLATLDPRGMGTWPKPPVNPP